MIVCLEMISLSRASLWCWFYGVCGESDSVRRLQVAISDESNNEVDVGSSEEFFKD